MRTRELSEGIWAVTTPGKRWVGRAESAADARSKAADMWLGR